MVNFKCRAGDKRGEEDWWDMKPEREEDRLEGPEKTMSQLALSLREWGKPTEGSEPKSDMI